jgi:protein phosphatase
MKIIPGNAQDIGTRASQEDSFGFSDLQDRAFKRHAGVMMVLCDGMGGLADGAVASRVAVDAALQGYTRKQPSEDIPTALERVVREAHDAVCAAFANGESGGATIVAAVICADLLYWASLGDSRLYLVRRDATVQQLTVDHNVANLEHHTALGEAPRSEAMSAANPEALTGYLGSPYPPRPDSNRGGMPLLPGDRIVACSDGVYRGLSTEALAAIALHGRPMAAAEYMIKSVLEQGIPHQDNLTAVIFEVSRPRPLAQLVAMRGPAVPVLLYGALGGVAAVVLCVLVIIVTLHFRHGDVPSTSAPAPADATSEPTPQPGNVPPPAAPQPNQPASTVPVPGPPTGSHQGSRPGMDTR